MLRRARHLDRRGIPAAARRAASSLAAHIDSECKATAAGETLRLAYSDGKTLSFHPIWLRERCLAPSSADPATRQRFFDAADFSPTGLRLNSVELSACGADVSVEFSDGHVSRFGAADLREELESASVGSRWMGAGVPLPERTLWSSRDLEQDPSLLWHDFDAIVDAGSNSTSDAERPPGAAWRPRDDDATFAFISSLHSLGVAVVRGVPAFDGAVLAFARTIGPVRDTNWGTLFDVRTQQESADGAAPKSTEDLAYTEEEIRLHVDNPYRDPIPQYQLLHVLQQTRVPGGGATIVADGFRAAERLRAEDPEAFALLTRARARFQYQDDNTFLQTTRPHIVTEPDGTLKRVTLSGRLDYCAFPDGPGGETGPDAFARFYAAKHRLVALSEADDSIFRTRLDSGDLLIVDNQRVMHGRSAFRAADGAGGGDRWVQGCYIDKDSTSSRFWTLNRRLAARASAVGASV
jgi:gamma-butyrobetaine dioxygenase